MSQATMIPNQAVEKLTPILNKQVANCAVLFMKLHNYHWFVKGSDFFTLHTKFEDLYNEVKNHMDVLAERLLSIGGQPIGDLRTCLQQTSIKEASTGIDATAMVQDVIHDLQLIIGELQQGIKNSDELGDQVTSDLFVNMCGSFEKHIWMLNAHLG